MSSGVLSEEAISHQWPLHWLVWNNDSKGLNRLLEQGGYNKEALDPRGRTPLHLAVSLKHTKCTEILLYYGANTLALNRHQWSVLHEAVSTGDNFLCGMVLALRDRQQMNSRAKEIPLMLERLQSASDFYIEMKWEFTSWVPFLSRMCPSDTYKIWKKGTKVRVDTSLIGFQNMQWLRGNRSVIFEVTGATFVEIDHDAHSIWEHPFQIDDRHMDPVQQMLSHEMAVMRRLKSPLVSTVFLSQNVSFERQKAGIWGFRSEKTETVNGYKAKVFSVSGLDIVTRTRVDHLPDDEKEKQKSAGISPLQDFLGMSEEAETDTGVGGSFLPGNTPINEGTQSADNKLTLLEYFTPPNDPKKYDALGSKVDVSSRVQGIKASVWLSEEYPLSLQDQILPIIELMSLNNAHFAKLKDFITLQMPSGYPVKFEIPLFHVMSARVTFGNINGYSQPVPHVSLKTEQVTDDVPMTVSAHDSKDTTGGHPYNSSSNIKRRHTSSESDPGPSQGAEHDVFLTDTPTSITTPTQTREICVINDGAFTRPTGYRTNNQYVSGGGTELVDQEEELLQMVIRQSLIEQGLPLPENETNEQELSLVEALKDQSIMSANSNSRRGYPLPPPPSDDISLAIAMSQAHANEEVRLRQEEEDELERVLKLSLLEK